VVDSPRQLWSVAGYLDMVVRGIFGLEDDGSVAPELPASLVPMLFGTARQITLYLDGQQIVLDRPSRAGGPLLVAGRVQRQGEVTEVQLVATAARAAAPRMKAPMYLSGPASADASVPPRPSAVPGVGPAGRVVGPWPRHWTAPHRGEYVVWLDYSNPHGPINTGITAAVKRLEIRCAGSPRQVLPIVMPQSEGWQPSTTARFEADAGASCAFTLLQGFNMSDLARFAHYTGGLLPPPAPAPAAASASNSSHAATAKPATPPKPVANGGVTGPLNSARIGAVRVAPLTGTDSAPEPRAAIH
jgi:hypothetical protein